MRTYLTVNGRRHAGEVEPRTYLLDALRRMNRQRIPSGSSHASSSGCLMFSETGRAQWPAPQSVPTYKVVVEGERIKVEVT
jgi:aerobic-type carbon monoxide dehydrogenase small subunit (CoxS/CutS family)